jgi:hypothetical protein
MAKKPKGKAKAEEAQPKPIVQRHITTVEELPEEDESHHVVFDRTPGRFVLHPMDLINKFH